jgi:hypothetical protein
MSGTRSKQGMAHLSDDIARRLLREIDELVKLRT